MTTSTYYADLVTELERVQPDFNAWGLDGWLAWGAARQRTPEEEMAMSDRQFRWYYLGVELRMPHSADLAQARRDVTATFEALHTRQCVRRRGLSTRRAAELGAAWAWAVERKRALETIVGEECRPERLRLQTVRRQRDADQRVLNARQRGDEGYDG